MEYRFEIVYKTGETEKGYTVAADWCEAIHNIIIPEEVNDVFCVNFEYTVTHTAHLENEDVVNLIKAEV